MQRPQDDLVESRARLLATVEHALLKLATGVLPDRAERQAVDFKEEAGRRGRGGVLLAAEPRNLAAADSLADEVACMANSPGGGALVVGVEDATGSLLGTALDHEWLRHRIWERVDIAPVVEPRDVSGFRLLVLLVAEAREPVEDISGRIRWRTGGHCTPVDRAEWWLHRQATGGHDPLAVASTRTQHDVAPASLARVRRLLADGDDGNVTDSDHDLLTRLGAVRPDGALTQAAALVFCPSQRPVVTVSVLDVEGGDVVVPAPDLSGLSLLEQLMVVEDRLDAVNTAVTLRNGFARDAATVPAAVCRAGGDLQCPGAPGLVAVRAGRGHLGPGGRSPHSHQPRRVRRWSRLGERADHPLRAVARPGRSLPSASAGGEARTGSGPDGSGAGQRRAPSAAVGTRRRAPCPTPDDRR